MPARSAPPFRVPHDDRIDARIWLLGDGENPLEPRLTTWDYATPLSLKRWVSVDGAGLRGDADLPADAAMDLLVTVQSSSTGIRRVVYGADLVDGDQLVEAHVPPHELGGTITVTTQITLRSTSRTSLLGASRPGSVLWAHTIKVDLEGDAARFPVVVVPFTRSGFPSGAPWLIDLDVEDLERPAMATARVYINAEHETARTMAIDPAASETSRAMADALQSDIALRMLRAAMTTEDLVDDGRYPEGSIGEALLALIQTCLPHTDLSSIRSLSPSAIGTTEATLVAALGLYR